MGFCTNGCGRTGQNKSPYLALPAPGVFPVVTVKNAESFYESLHPFVQTHATFAVFITGSADKPRETLDP